MSLLRLSTLAFFCLLFPVLAIAQQDQLILRLGTQLRQSAPDTNRLEILLELGWYYVARPGEYKPDLDSAFLYLKAAKNLDEQIGTNPLSELTLWYLSLCYFEARQAQPAKDLCVEMIDKFYRSAGKAEEEAATWFRMAKSINRNDSTFSTLIFFLEQARLKYGQLQNKEKQIEAYKEIADIHLNQGKLDQSEKELLEVIDMYKSIGFRNLHYTYDLLSAVSTLKGNLNRALYYALEMIKSMETTGDSAVAGVFYYRLAKVYGDLGQTEQSVKWLQKANAQSPNPHYGVCRRIALGLIELGKAAEALSFIQNTVRRSPPGPFMDKAYVANAMGDCHNALQSYDLAERYYLQMVYYQRLLKARDYYSVTVNYTIAAFYVNRFRYAEAEFYLKKILTNPSGIATTQQMKDTHLLLFKVDSAGGNYLSAIQHYQRHKLLNDSLFNETKSRQIEELQIQYETEKKEQDLRLLQNESALQQSRLQQANLTKNLSFGGGALLLIILGLLYNRFRLKHRSNRQLEIQQIEINQTNRSLQNLLEEKERLLREIHHRVKNNLQIVMSLLNSQSVYLENDAASTAIRDSQHRIHSISLIHQKLYQSENIGQVDMQVYIRELVEYLQDSFNTGKNIHFDLNITPTEFDVTQAVPIGLILNEAISNAIKYAFPTSNTGQVAISMQQAGQDRFLLSISDNGVGLPADFDPQNFNSLGMSLMQGLSKQLHGTLELTSNNGLIINILFVKDKSLQADTASPDMNLIA